MADRAPGESTSGLVHRQYGVPERQMGVNQGRVYPDANDPKSPARMRTLWSSTPISEAYAPPIAHPAVKDTSAMNVPAYLQRALGGINHQPAPYVMPNRAGTLGAAPRPTTITTVPQPAQAGH